MSDDVAAVLTELACGGSCGIHEALAALTAAGYAVVKVPEGVAVAHGARLVHSALDQDVLIIEPPEKDAP